MKYTKCASCGDKLYVGEIAYEYQKYLFCTKFCLERYINENAEIMNVTLSNCDMEEDAE